MKRGELSFKGLGALLFLAISAYFLMPSGDLFAILDYGLTVVISPGGGGSVQSSDGYIICPTACGYSYYPDTSVTLTAYPSPGYQFSSWSGSVPGSTNPITFNMDSNKSETANFTPIPPPPTNYPPVLNPIGDKRVNEGELLTFTISATDRDGDRLSFSATGLPRGASFSGQAFSWTPNFTQAGTYQVTFQVSDGEDIDSERITITVINVNRPPVLSTIGNKRVNENELLAFDISATDPDGDRLTYSASGLPQGASFSGQSFSWTPDYTQAGTYPITFLVSDGRATDGEEITITVTNVNRPPVLDPIGNKDINENVLLTIILSASDPDGDPLTYSAMNLPPGAEFNPQTQLFEWTPAIGQNGTYQVEFQVSDGEFADSELITIEVGICLPALPDPFSYDEVNPSQGKAGVDPENICFIWPGAGCAQNYDFLLSRNREFSQTEIEIEGLTEPFYCIGTATTSLTIEGLSEPHSSAGIPTASRTGEGLSPTQNYFWTITARNLHGEVNYPVFGFFTRMPEGAEIESPQPLADLEYQMISVPLYPENPDPIAVLGDDLGPYIRSEWRLFYYESSDGQNHEYPGVPDMTPGLAYWLIAKVGVKIDAQGSPVDTETEFVIQIPPGFFQLGCPFYFPVSWREVKVRKGEATVLIGDPANIWVSPNLWKYENGSYALTEVLEPWKGYWIKNMSLEGVELLIPPKMLVEQE